MNRFFLLLRRLHLYSGLLMLPFVLIYGTSAIVFNHPAWFATEPVVAVGRVTDPFPAADGIAKAVVAALSSEARCTLLEASWAGDLVLTGAERTIRVGPDGHATVRRTNARERAPIARRLEATHRDLVDAARRDVAPLASDVKVQRAPSIRMRVLIDDRPWTVTYNVQTGAVESAPVSSAPLSQLVARLHLTHGWGAAWHWALGVDALAVTFLFWGVSGTLMWVQMRALRRGGLVSFVLGLAVSAALVGATLR